MITRTQSYTMYIGPNDAGKPCASDAMVFDDCKYVLREFLHNEPGMSRTKVKNGRKFQVTVTFTPIED